MKNMMKKLKKNTGFTLAETLMTVLILVMVAGVVAGGVPAAVRAYSKAVEAANAEVLLSTTVNALRSKLSTASDVDVKDNAVTYIDSDTGALAKLSLEDGVITVQDFLPFAGTGPENAKYNLVSEKTASDNLTVTCGGVDWSTGDGAEGTEGAGDTAGAKEVVRFTDIKVTKKDEDHPIAEIKVFYIRPLTGKLAIPGGA